MITNVTVPASQCSCDKCGHIWISTAVLPPVFCANQECRSREWNGKKKKRLPTKKPQVVLPPPIKIRGESEDEF